MYCLPHINNNSNYLHLIFFPTYISVDLLPPIQGNKTTFIWILTWAFSLLGNCQNCLTAVYKLPSYVDSCLYIHVIRRQLFICSRHTSAAAYMLPSLVDSCLYAPITCRQLFICSHHTSAADYMIPSHVGSCSYAPVTRRQQFICSRHTSAAVYMLPSHVG